MADKVDNNLEKMVDELAYYKEEALFSGKEITKIVNSAVLMNTAWSAKMQMFHFSLMR